MGVLLVNEPKALPAALLQVFKRAFRKVWRVRGGGLYACGFFIAFIWLEISMFFSEIYAAESAGSFFSGQILELLFRFSVLSLQNTVNALIWPVHIIMLSLAVGGWCWSARTCYLKTSSRVPWKNGYSEMTRNPMTHLKNPDSR